MRDILHFPGIEPVNIDVRGKIIVVQPVIVGVAHCQTVIPAERQ
jgi:hypothetical protein